MRGPPGCARSAATFSSAETSDRSGRMSCSARSAHARLAGGVAADRDARRPGRQRRRRRCAAPGGGRTAVSVAKDGRGLHARAVRLARWRPSGGAAVRPRPARRSSRRPPSRCRSRPTAKSSTGSDFSGRSSPEPAKAECCSSRQPVAVSRSTKPSGGSGKAGSSGSGAFGSTSSDVVDRRVARRSCRARDHRDDGAHAPAVPGRAPPRSPSSRAAAGRRSATASPAESRSITDVPPGGHGAAVGQARDGEQLLRARHRAQQRGARPRPPATRRRR